MKVSCAIFFTAALALTVAGCNRASSDGSTSSVSQGPTTATQADLNTLVCLSGSELENIRPLLPQLEKETGVHLELVSSGTLASVEKLQSGASGYDCGWFSHNKYLMLDNQVKGLVVKSERIMSSPVILGVKPDKAAALHWSADKTTWSDVAKAANDGNFTFAMTSPASSNTGMSALIGVTAALAESASAIDEKAIARVELSGFGKGHVLFADSSGWLTTAFAKELANPKGPDGIINYESELLRLNATEKANLTLIYPKEGIITADYPLMLFNVDKKTQFDKVTAFFKRDAIQKVLMTTTYRRPASSNVTADPSLFGDHLLVEVPFPGKVEVIDSLLMSYLDKQRRPAHVYFVLDTSGSMGTNGGIEQLRNAMIGLTGVDESITGRFAKFRSRERVTVVEFAGAVKSLKSFEVSVDSGKKQSEMTNLSTYAANLSANGGTAIFDATRVAYDLAVKNQKLEPGYLQSVVVMTDGANNFGMDEADFTQYFSALPTDAKNVRVFGVLFGASASAAQIKTLTTLTGGEVFDGTKSISTVFKRIRGYQ